MGNTARLAYVASGIKRASADAGSKNIFISFGKLYDDCLVAEQQLYFHCLPAGITEAAQAVGALRDKGAHRGLYFCGAQPLARHDWIRRLRGQVGDLDFNVVVRTPDTKYLSDILHIVSKIDFSFPLRLYRENPAELRDFITLANFRQVYLTIYLDGETPSADFLSLAEMLSGINTSLPVFLQGAPETAGKCYSLAAGCLTGVAINTAII